MKTAIACLALLFAVPSFAATSRTVSYKSGDDTVQAILYTPEVQGPLPGIVVIHEWWGLNDWVKEQASKLADQGYVALAIDLYRGKVATTPDMAHELTRSIQGKRLISDLHAAYAFLKSQPNVKPDRIAAIGWCMGGGFALDMALVEPTLAATVINYGELETDPNELKKINGPILGLFGAQDHGITSDDVHKFEATLKQLGKKIDVTIYPDAGHAFQNRNNKSAYRPADTEDAWKRTTAFLASRLKK